MNAFRDAVVDKPLVLTAARQWNITVGNFFFKYRNAIFPLVMAAMVLVMRPRVILGDPVVDRALAACGMVIAIAGQTVRLLTIGYDYIDRGGKNKQVYASRLVERGLYAVTRNPMYVGNLLITVGICMVAGTPANYVIVIPLFVFIYQAIIAAEEAYLLNRFGQDYADYCARVRRFVPSLQSLTSALSGMRYDWRRAIRKDLSTMAGLLGGLIVLPVWRTYFLRGFDAAKAQAHLAVVWATVVGVAYGLLVYAKKRRWLLYSPQEL